MKRILADTDFQLFIFCVIILTICILIVSSSYFFWTKILAYWGIWYAGWGTIGSIFLFIYRFLKLLINYPVNHSPKK